MKRFKILHEVRPYGAIGIFVSAARIVYAVNKEEAIDIAREQWHTAKHETRGVIVQPVYRNQLLIGQDPRFPPR